MRKLLKNSGFTLVELAIVLVVVTLLLTGMLVPFGAQIQNRRIAETQKTLEEIRGAIIGFAIINKRLPRPAASAINGSEVPNCGGDDTCTGFVPWSTLGINGLDAWGKRIRYSVSPTFTTAIPVSPSNTGSKTVNTRDAAGNTTSLITQPVPVVIVSFGAKNFGNSESGASIANTSTTNIDEQSNFAADKIFMSRTITESTATTGGEFDDIVVWIPANTIIKSMNDAGVCPNALSGSC